MKILTRKLILTNGMIRLGAVLLSLILSGCVVGPKYHPPAPQAPAAVYKESPANSNEAEGWTVAQPADAKLRGKWWEIFNDPELNALEEQLDINNQNIKQFFENFMEARAIVREARAQYFPTLTVVPAVTHSRASANVGATTATTAGTGTTSSPQLQSTLYTLPLEASWEPDLWGKVRNTVRQAQYAAQVSAADLENERLTEQASLAEYFFEIRGQDRLQEIYNDTVAADQKAYDLTRSLYETGIDDQISVVEAETTLRSAQAGATNVGIARAQFEHAIAVLIGKAASDFSIPVKPMTAAPPPIPVGVPSELLERRPDVAAAERLMAEANASIGIAYAAYYPNLTLTAEGGFESSVLPSLASHGRAVSGPLARRFPKPSSMPACAAPPSNNTWRPTMLISPPTVRRCFPHFNRWKMVLQKCASCPRRSSKSSRQSSQRKPSSSSNRRATTPASIPTSTCSSPRPQFSPTSRL